MTKESGEQKAVCDWLRIHKIGFFSVPNGTMIGGRNKYALIQKLKNEGLLPGAPDLVLIDPAPLVGVPVAIEMKKKEGGKTSDAQREVAGQMRARGWRVIVAEGADRAIELLKEIGFGS